MKDITGDIGESKEKHQYLLKQGEVKYPMYTFARPAYMFWQGFYNGLRKSGISHKEALTHMQGKGVRWLFDQDGDQEMEKVGQLFAKEFLDGKLDEVIFDMGYTKEDFK